MFPRTPSAPSPSAPEGPGRPLQAPHLVTRPHAELLLEPRAVRFQGRFGYEKIHARSGLVTEAGSFPNLITDAGLNALGTSYMTSLVSYLGVGGPSSGNGNAATPAPAPGDLQLFNELVRTNYSGGFTDEWGYDATDASRPFHWYRKVFLFTETQANGTLTELGTFNASGGGVMWTRQLFRDTDGNAITITKTSDEQLKLYYEWRVYPPLTSTTEVVTVNGVDVTVTNRASNIGDYWTWGPGGVLRNFGNWGIYAALFESSAMPALTGTQSGTAWGASTSTTSPYVSGNLYRDGELRWDPANANSPSGKLGSMQLTYYNGFNTPFISTFVPALTKTVNDRVIIQARISWARASA